MDHRIFKAKIGKPIPAWDLAHQLPIYGWVGPDCRDDGTIFRLNSTFMDVSEQCHLTRQEYSFGLFLAMLIAAMLAGMLALIALDLFEKSRPIGAYSFLAMVAGGLSVTRHLSWFLEEKSSFAVRFIPSGLIEPKGRSTHWFVAEKQGVAELMGITLRSSSGAIVRCFASIVNSTI